MYGLVNKAVEGLITSKFGEETWNNIKEDAGVDIDLFISNESYPDEITFKLAIAASKILNISLNEVLRVLGHYWIEEVAAQHYGALMNAGGSSFSEFLINLPNFHRRVHMIFPNLTPPSFQIKNPTDRSLDLIYESTRTGLEDFVVGLLEGLAKRYEVELSIQSEVMETNPTPPVKTLHLFKIEWT